MPTAPQYYDEGAAGRGDSARMVVSSLHAQPMPLYSHRVALNNRFETLTETETLTLRVYLQTSDPKDIARELGKSPHTIEKYLKSARQKLGVRRSLDAAHLLAQHEGNPLYGEVVYRPSAGGVSLAQMLFGGPERPWVALPKWTRVGLVVGGLIAITVIAVLAIDIAETLSRLNRP